MRSITLALCSIVSVYGTSIWSHFSSRIYILGIANLLQQIATSYLDKNIGVLQMLFCQSLYLDKPHKVIRVCSIVVYQQLLLPLVLLLDSQRQHLRGQSPGLMEEIHAPFVREQSSPARLKIGPQHGHCEPGLPLAVWEC